MNQSILTSYSYSLQFSNLKSKLEPEQYRAIVQASNGQKQTLATPRVRPTWICFLSDLLNSRDLSSYEQFIDYKQECQSIIDAVASFKMSELKQGQCYTIAISDSRLILNIETLIIDATGVEKPKRVIAPVDDLSLCSKISIFASAALRRFIPTMITSFIDCVISNKVDASSIPESDVRFSDFLIANLAGGLGITKNDFCSSGKPIDFYYALNYHPDPRYNPLTPLTIMTLHHTAPSIGCNIASSPKLMAPHTLIGSEALSVQGGQMVKRMVQTPSRPILVKLLSFTSSVAVNNVTDILSSLSPISTITLASSEVESDKNVDDDNEFDPELNGK